MDSCPDTDTDPTLLTLLNRLLSDKQFDIACLVVNNNILFMLYLIQLFTLKQARAWV